MLVLPKTRIQRHLSRLPHGEGQNEVAYSLFSAKCHTKGKGDDGRCVELPKQRSHSRDDED